MKICLLALICLVLGTGCSLVGTRVETRYPPRSFPSNIALFRGCGRQAPEGQAAEIAMTPAEAAEFLGLVEPIEVDDFSSVGKRPPKGEKIYFMDDGIVQAIIHDADGRYVSIRIEENPRYDALADSDGIPPYLFYLKIYEGRGLGAVLLNKGAGQETEILEGDNRLTAFEVLCRDWIMRRFTPEEIRQMDFDDAGRTRDEAKAAFLMWYFDPVDMAD